MDLVVKVPARTFEGCRFERRRCCIDIDCDYRLFQTSTKKKMNKKKKMEKMTLILVLMTMMVHREQRRSIASENLSIFQPDYF